MCIIFLSSVIVTYICKKIYHINFDIIHDFKNPHGSLERNDCEYWETTAFSFTETMATKPEIEGRRNTAKGNDREKRQTNISSTSTQVLCSEIIGQTMTSSYTPRLNEDYNSREIIN